VNLVLAEAKVRLQLPVEFGAIDLTFFQTFPDVAIRVEDFVLFKTCEKQDTLMLAKQLFLEFNLPAFLKRNYQVHQMQFSTGSIPNPVALWDKLKSTSATGALPNRGVEFNLKALYLRNIATAIPYTTNIHLPIDVIDAEIALSGKDKIAASGKSEILIKDWKNSSLADSELELAFSVDLEPQSQKIEIKSAGVKLRGFAASFQGLVNLNSKTLDIQFVSKDQNLPKLLIFLFPKELKTIKEFIEAGEITLTGKVAGENFAKSRPLLNLSLQGKNIVFQIREGKSKIRKLAFTGTFTNGSKRNLETYSLKLDPLSGQLNDRGLTAFFHWVDFTQKQFKLRVNTTQKVAEVLRFYPIKYFEPGIGDVELSLDIGLQQNENGQDKIMLRSGELKLRDVAVKFLPWERDFHNLNGDLLFNQRHLAINELNGQHNSNTFDFTGAITHLFDQQSTVAPIHVSGELNADYLNLVEWLHRSDVSEGPETSEKAKMTATVSFDLTDFKVGKHQLKNAKGNMEYGEEKVTLRNMHFDYLQGTFETTSEIDIRNINAIQIKTITQWNKVPIDSFLYAFDNFDQSLLTHHHLKGTTFGKFEGRLLLDSLFNPVLKETNARVNLSVKNGELIRFEPIMKISRFFKAKQLDHLKLQEFSTQLLIGENRLSIRETEIPFTDAPFWLRGYYSFDQNLEYHLKVPLKNKWRLVEGSMANSGPNLYLKIEGPTEEVRIGLDKQSVKQKISKDVKKEGRELAEIFKNKGRESPDYLEPEDEYFEWEEESE